MSSPSLPIRMSLPCAAVERELDCARGDARRFDDVVAVAEPSIDDPVVRSFRAGDVDLRSQAENADAGRVAEHQRDIVAIGAVRR